MIDLTDVTLILPTFRRTTRQVTWSYLPPALRAHVVLAAPADELPALAQLPGIRADQLLAEPADLAPGMGAKRQWMLEWCPTRYMIQLDDDLEFHARANGSLTKGAATESRVTRVFAALCDALRAGVPHVGLGSRQGNNTIEGDWAVNTRLMCAWGHDVTRVREFMKAVPEIRFREDLQWTLELLLRGFPNALCAKVVVSQQGYNREGGCSTLRTMDVSNAEAVALAARYPKFVRTVERPYRVSEPRTEVIVQWRRAFASSGADAAWVHDVVADLSARHLTWES